LADIRERPLVAVVGADTLLAKELRDLLAAAKSPPRVQLIAAAPDGATILAAEEDDVEVMTPLIEESLVGVKVAFLAGSPASSRKAVKVAQKPSLRTDAQQSIKIIDLSGALEDRPNARLRAPQAEPLPPSDLDDSVQVIAHPGAIALTIFLAALARSGKLRRTLIHVFEPASERGKKGLEELRQQTVGVLSFQKLKTDVFDTQVSFNLVAGYGQEAMEPLDSIEQRLERHLASLLSAWPGIPMPSLRLIQAPVFHGYSFSVWAEFEEPVHRDSLQSTLVAAELDIRTEEPPSNVGTAGQSGLSVGGIRVDRNNPRACWFWMVADNLRLTAENAIAVAKESL
jgi:aspartate-semialdehyde dehydrogenase